MQTGVYWYWLSMQLWYLDKDDMVEFSVLIKILNQGFMASSNGIKILLLARKLDYDYSFIIIFYFLFYNKKILFLNVSFILYYYNEKYFVFKIA